MGLLAWHSRGPERREVVLSEERSCRFMHGGLIEFLRDVPNTVCIQRGRRPAIEDPVHVMPLDRRQPRVETGWHHLHLKDRDRNTLQVCVRCVAHRVDRPLLGQIHVNHLVGSMNAGIGAPGAMNANDLAGKSPYGFLDDLLDRQAVGLICQPAKGVPSYSTISL